MKTIKLCLIIIAIAQAYYAIVDVLYLLNNLNIIHLF